MPETATESKPSRTRPDSYRAAAAAAGVTVSHAWRVIHGLRAPSADTARRLRAWAAQQHQQGRGDADAVQLTLRNIAA